MTSVLHEEDLHIYYLNMPTTVHGRTVPNADGTYSIFINSRLSYEGQERAKEDEIAHIRKNHFDYDNEKSVQELECESHGIEIEPKKDDLIAKRRIRRKRRFNRKWKDLQKRRRFLESVGFDFMADAERRYLEPD